MRRSARLSGALAFLVAILAPTAAIPVLYIDINAPGGKRMPIAVAAFVVSSGDPALSRSIPGIIEGDLAITELFDLVPEKAHMEAVTPAHFSGTPLSFPAWKVIGAQAVVIGRLDVRGEQVSVEMRLYDATQGTLMAGKRYSGSPRQLRAIAHRFSNEIVYAFTGVRGIFGTEVAFTARPRGGKG
jgi:TolB protein